MTAQCWYTNPEEHMHWAESETHNNTHKKYKHILWDILYIHIKKSLNSDKMPSTPGSSLPAIPATLPSTNVHLQPIIAMSHTAPQHP